MKLSFSLRPKSRSRVRSISDIDESNLKEFVTEFDPSKPLTDAKPRFVIPPIENRWRPHKVMKNIHLLQSASSGLQFESDISSGGSDNVTYGLNLRHNVEDKPAPVEQQMLLKSMRREFESLPDAPDLEDFESVPVEGFGAALLAGYGWKPGQGIGLKAKEDVPIVEYKKWVDNQGFGFKSSVKGTMNAKAKERGPNITSGHLSSSFVVGKEVTTVAGRQVAFNGKKQLGDSGSHEIENNVEKYRKVSTRQHEARASNKKKDKRNASWLRTHIRVRVISKHVKGGRLYLKKAVVTDVIGPTTCDITMDETQELVQGINQELLETALPRRGGPVLILSGRHKGVYGSLVEKDLDKETGVICDADSKEMLDVKLEQVAEYMGDPDDIGY